MLITSAFLLVLDVSTFRDHEQLSLSKLINPTTLQTSRIATTSTHLVTISRIVLPWLSSSFSRKRDAKGLSSARLATLFLVWAIAIPFCKVLVYITETLVAQTGLSRNFVGGVVWPVITNLPVLVIVMAQITPLGAVLALQYSTASVHFLCAFYEILGQK